MSVFLNPAGIATQSDQISISYQTYTAYPKKENRLFEDEIETSVEAESGLADPAFLPSYLGAVFQLGSPDSPMAIGLCFARPYHLHYAFDELEDPLATTFSPDSDMDQALGRFRAAFAYDFRFREVGEAGFFSHLAVGLGLDVGFVQWKFSGTTRNEADTSTGFGGGLGLLLGVYDNTENFKVNFGLAYHSSIQYDFSISPNLLPSFDMPQQFNAGFTFYLLEGTPLRLTIDFQWIEWSETAEKPTPSVPLNSFDDAFNYSIGMEFRVRVSEKVYLYPRLGYRHFDAPWEDKDDLPTTGHFRLVLDTDDDSFNIFTMGLGVSWTTEEGNFRTVDLAGDFGGDTFNAAIGYNHEF